MPDMHVQILEDRPASSRAADTSDARLGVRVRQLRRLRGLSQADIAQALGVTYQQVQKYETGKTRLPARMLPVLARMLGVDTELLLAGVQAQEAIVPPHQGPDERETAELVSAFASMRHPQSRRRLLSIVKAFAAEAGAADM
ncbi:helix-turn-helix transcriptional regulator [Roseomonas stagni]|uniref:Helix-turn-helix transcriptional regulator n=1 Tax=Falsiroseomonas algicola TaxID=2716930 RepID=A0A6M1LWD7_9PROT|nr:helix-turn-helix transcriptional regulator [Falsiroseomonas algicola]NGM23794.1 helix-turn-helix transcriptional regulator [Falsiroseomonas algicola]